MNDRNLNVEKNEINVHLRVLTEENNTFYAAKVKGFTKPNLYLQIVVCKPIDFLFMLDSLTDEKAMDEMILLFNLIKNLIIAGVPPMINDVIETKWLYQIVERKFSEWGSNNVSITYDINFGYNR
ncbi:hypothetical protein [Spirosoma agri]|uniref:Uncharacterized protein n=1 Tax=Spirosoma agri TaxID=1987381 RepID=A0A6M0IRL2_9BACT|nr:hypothetical protein [Spirosoma agri]NEU70567.1 hypothetical protein [Spirosoma agri]